MRLIDEALGVEDIAKVSEIASPVYMLRQVHKQERILYVEQMDDCEHFNLWDELQSISFHVS
jgi:hypothetical protein